MKKETDHQFVPTEMDGDHVNRITVKYVEPEFIMKQDGMDEEYLETGTLNLQSVPTDTQSTAYALAVGINRHILSNAQKRSRSNAPKETDEDNSEVFRGFLPSDVEDAHECKVRRYATSQHK